MSHEANPETLGFQAEVKQLLHLMVHSLYSNREIFLRELISNASDAADKLRFEAMTNPSLLEKDAELRIRISCDAEAGTIEVSDNGIGMSREDVVANLGTIAKSGTSEFLRALDGDKQKDARLIGQFGVGFYSSFIVAERVEVLSRRAGVPASDGVRWESSGDGSFTVESIERPERGTTILLYLKQDDRDFADPARLRMLVRKYSDHIGFPVQMRAIEEQGEGEFETVNESTALWTMPKNEISDEDYVEFYKHISHDFEAPLAWTHNRVEGKREYVSLLYVPSHAPFDLWNRDAPRGVKLYAQRGFIMDQAEQFLPLFLRFIRGVVDSSDLSLNISREMLQQDSGVEAMRSALTRRVLDMLGRLAETEPEKYARFWDEFGQVLKEGVVEEPGQHAALAPLLRFASTADESAGQTRSLADYVAAMPADQKTIYFVYGESDSAARNSPHLEALREQGIEVLVLSDRIDEIMIGHLAEFDGKPFRDVVRGELELGDAGSGRETESQANDALLDRIRDVLGGKVAGVRRTRRLTESPACLVVGEHEPSAHLRRMLEAAGQSLPAAAPTLEINTGHPLLERLAAEENEGRFSDLSLLLFEQARLAEGGTPDDPAGFVKRLNRLLLDMTDSRRVWTPD
jgi:molecular chaperone HtpG